MPRIVIIIQARMSSTRLPGKVLLPLNGKPVLGWIVHRLRRSRLSDQLVVATSTNLLDDAVAEWCQAEGVAVYRGHEADVLDRYYQAAQHCEADIIVRITADCPLIDPVLVDFGVSMFLSLSPRPDYLTIESPAYPRGLDVEVVSREALTRAWASEQPATWREHVTYYIAQHPEQFHNHCVDNLGTFPDDDYRWTIDTAADFEFIERVYQHFGHGDFSWHDVLEAMKEHPEWQEINRSVRQKKV
jgi:spore coat polysaccharide biosynthesis protein SpsF